MKKMKRLLMLLVAFALVVSSGAFSVSVLAEDTVVPDKSPAVIKITEADMLLVEKLEALGIVKDIDADLTAKVTRREMAELVAGYLRLPNASVDLDVSPFSDVPLTDSAINAIVALYNMQIITGDDMKQFYPDANLNYDEALVFIVNAVGYKLFAARDGGFPTGYHRIAIQLGLLKELSMQSGRDEITRLDVYKLMEAGLRAAAVTYDGYTENAMQYTISTTEDFLSNTHGITTHKGIITGSEDTYLTNATSKMTDEQIEIDGVLYDTPGYIYATSLGRSVIYYLRSDGSDGKEISYIEENDALNNVVKIDARDILPGKSTSSRIYYEDQDEKECHVDFAGAVDVIFNGRLFRGYGHILNALPAAGYIETVDNDGDKLVDVMFVYEYRNVLVSGIDTYKQEIITSTGERILCDIEGGNARLYFASETLPSPLIHVEQDCIASVMESKGTPRLVTVYISEDTIDGTISEVLSDGSVIIDGVKYKKAVDYTGVALVAGESVSLKLDFNGQIAYGDYGASGAELERCVLTALDYEQGYFENRVAIRVFKKSKTFEEISLNEKVTINDVRYDLNNATDMENVLKVLSENQIVNGYYAVTEARIISCEFDGDKITHINTGTSGTRGNTQLLENRSSHVLCNSSPQVLTITKEAGGNIYGVYNKSLIDVFAAPYNDPSTPENELMGTDGYAYGLTLEQKIYAPKTGVDYTYTRNTAIYYKPSDDGINNVTAVLFRGSARATTATNGVDIESKFYLVSKVSSAIDEDGLTCKKLYFGTDGKLLSDTLSVHDKTGLHTNLSQTDPLVTRIDAGYVIQYGLNSDGKINAIRIASDFDKTTGAVSHQYNWGDFPKGTKYASGVVLENSTASRTITIDAWNTSEGNLFGRVGGTIYIYHSADGELVQATQSEIRIGDKITAHIKTYHTFSEIFIIR